MNWISAASEALTAVLSGQKTCAGCGLPWTRGCGWVKWCHRCYPRALKARTQKPPRNMIARNFALKIRACITCGNEFIPTVHQQRRCDECKQKQPARPPYVVCRSSGGSSK